jgi:hypothetical protein
MLLSRSPVFQTAMHTAFKKMVDSMWHILDCCCCCCCHCCCFPWPL